MLLKVDGIKYFSEVAQESDLFFGVITKSLYNIYKNYIKRKISKRMQTFSF